MPPQPPQPQGWHSAPPPPHPQVVQWDAGRGMGPGAHAAPRGGPPMGGPMPPGVAPGGVVPGQYPGQGQYAPRPPTWFPPPGPPPQ